MTSAPFAHLRPPAIAIWAVGLLGYLWCAADLALRSFLGPATLLPLLACGMLLLTIPLTLMRAGRKYGMTLALYVIAAAIVGVAVTNDLRAGLPLPALAGLGGVLICCWISAALLIFDRQRQRAADKARAQSTLSEPAPAKSSAPARIATGPATLATGAATLAAGALIAGSAFLLPSGLDHHSVTAAAREPVPTAVSVVAWSGNPGKFLDYPHLVQTAGPGFISVQTSAVQAFDGQTGQARWHFAVPGTLGFQAIASADGSAVAVSLRPGAGAAVADRAWKLVVLDANTGDIRWSSWRPNSAPKHLIGMTDTEIWLSADAQSLTSIERISAADGTVLPAPAAIELPATCQERSRSVSAKSGQLLVSALCADGPALLSFDVLSATLGWTVAVASEQAEVLRVGAVAQFSDLAAIGNSSAALTVVVPFHPGTTQILAPSTVVDAGGRVLFTIPTDERPIQVLDSAVISWRAGSLIVHPLTGEAFTLTSPHCTPNENSGLLSLTDQIIASCPDRSAVGSWDMSGSSVTIPLELAEETDIWLWAIPGSVLVYDSMSGTVLGLR